MEKPIGWKVIATLGLWSALLWTGCTRTEAPVAAKDTSRPAPGAAAMAVLAKADAADGTVDKIVSKCVMCGLEMKGNPGHAVTLGEYKVHSCSAACAEAFGKDPEPALLALKIPEEKKP